MQKKRKNYKGVFCSCGVEVTTNSKSGKCRKCASRKKKDKAVFVCEMCYKVFQDYPCRKATRRFCSTKCFSASKVGVKLSRERVTKSVIGHQGEKSHFWKGGVTKENRLIRGSIQYINWRISIFERDNYTCQICGLRGVYLEADHIKPFAYFPELRFELSNGRTLCRECHKNTDTYKGRARKYAVT